MAGDSSALLAQIAALTDPPLRVGPQEGAPEGAELHTLWDGSEGGFAVQLRCNSETFSVDLGPFAVTWSRGDEDAVDEVIDLVAAALFGRARILRLDVRGKTHQLDLQFSSTPTGGQWVAYQSVRPKGRRWRWPWERGRTVELRNALRASASLRLGEGGVLPSAPWVGTVAPPSAVASPARLEVDGELDLHPFKPKEVKALVLEYIEAARAQGITELRLVHGKGIGNLRRTVHAILDRHEAVASYRLGGHGEGSWGATIVTLR